MKKWFFVHISLISLIFGCTEKNPLNDESDIAITFCHEVLTEAARYQVEILNHNFDGRDSKGQFSGYKSIFFGEIRLQNGFGAWSTETYGCSPGGNRFYAIIDEEFIYFGEENTRLSGYEIKENAGYVIQKSQELMWARCFLGQTFENGACAGTPEEVSFIEEGKAKSKYNYAGFDDWKVPSIFDLIEHTYCPDIKEKFNITQKFDPNTSELIYDRYSGGECVGEYSNPPFLTDVFPDYPIEGKALMTSTFDYKGNIYYIQFFGNSYYISSANPSQVSGYVRLVREVDDIDKK